MTQRFKRNLHLDVKRPNSNYFYMNVYDQLGKP